MPMNPLGWDLNEARVEQPAPDVQQGEALLNPLGWDLNGARIEAAEPDREHYGQHDDDCYRCKLQSLTFDRGRPKTHVKNGNPWEGSPVAERIKELTGVEVNTDIPPAKERP